MNRPCFKWSGVLGNAGNGGSNCNLLCSHKSSSFSWGIPQGPPAGLPYRLTFCLGLQRNLPGETEHFVRFSPITSQSGHPLPQLFYANLFQALLWSRRLHVRCILLSLFPRGLSSTLAPQLLGHDVWCPVGKIWGSNVPVTHLQGAEEGTLCSVILWPVSKEHGRRYHKAQRCCEAWSYYLAWEAVLPSTGPSPVSCWPVCPWHQPSHWIYWALVDKLSGLKQSTFWCIILL